MLWKLQVSRKNNLVQFPLLQPSFYLAAIAVCSKNLEFLKIPTGKSRWIRNSSRILKKKLLPSAPLTKFLKFIFSMKARKLTKSSPSIWHYLWSMCQTDGEDFVNFLAFLENTNFTRLKYFDHYLILSLAFFSSAVRILSEYRVADGSESEFRHHTDIKMPSQRAN